MANTIKLRRGTEAQRASIVPAAGEPLFTTDDKRLFIGDGATVGGIAMGNNVHEVADIPARDAISPVIEGDIVVVASETKTYIRGASAWVEMLAPSGGGGGGPAIYNGLIHDSGAAFHLPAGWTSSAAGPIFTITHNLGFTNVSSQQVVTATSLANNGVITYSGSPDANFFKLATYDLATHFQDPKTFFFVLFDFS